MRQIATVINNNQPGWTNIIETEPGVTLDVGTKLYVENDGERVVFPSDITRLELFKGSVGLWHASINFSERYGDGKTIQEAIDNAPRDAKQDWQVMHEILIAASDKAGDLSFTVLFGMLRDLASDFREEIERQK